jgi:O-antigen/teichoic acid export membrane protein
VLGAVLTWFLIGRYGLLGTGLALLATEVLGFIVRWCLFWVMARK